MDGRRGSVESPPPLSLSLLSSSEVSSRFVFWMSVLAGEPHSTTNKPQPQRTPQGFQQLWTDVLNKPNVRSKHLFLQPTSGTAEIQREGEREITRERRGECWEERWRKKRCGQWEIRELGKRRKNERGEGDVLQIATRRGRPIHGVDVCGVCMCGCSGVLERGREREMERGAETRRGKKKEKKWEITNLAEVSFLCSLSPTTAVSGWILIQHRHIPSAALCSYNWQ